MVFRLWLFMFLTPELFVSNQQYLTINLISSSVDSSDVKLLLKQSPTKLHFHLLKKLTFTLTDITMIDFLITHARFYLLHNFLRLSDKLRLLFEKPLGLLEPARTASESFTSAVSLEREVYDLFGTFFIGHGDLRRILTDYSFRGYPLRKDFPLTGFTELAYSIIHKSIISKSLHLVQELRQMNYSLSWFAVLSFLFLL